MNSRFYRVGGRQCRAVIRRLSWLAVICTFGGGPVPAQTNKFFTLLRPHTFRPDNVYTAAARPAMKGLRVAVLPLAAQSGAGDLPAGCTSLTPVLWEEAVKSKRFEAVTVDADKLRAATGRAAWTGAEVLPAEFFDYLRREYACDAVLFGEVTAYRAYAPLAVGWRFKLVDVQTGQVIWAADEMFDAADKQVAKAAQKYEHPGLRIPFVASPDWAVLNSPRKFGRYSAAALLGTLPER